MVTVWPGWTTTGETVGRPPTAACQRSPVTDLIAGSKAWVVAMRLVLTVSALGPVVPNGPTTSGTKLYSPAVSGLPPIVVETDNPTPEATSGHRSARPGRTGSARYRSSRP